MSFEELVIVAVLAVFILGPQRLPEYAAKLAQFVKQLRRMAEGAKDQLQEQLGSDYQDIDWRQYDPRQYDPRRIVRQALIDPIDEAIAPVRQTVDDVRNAANGRVDQPRADPPRPDPRSWDPERPTAYDTEAT